MSFERPNIAKMQGYTPGEQLDAEGLIKLNTNENPYPASPAVSTALQEIQVNMLRRYPPPLADEFRTAAAKLHSVASSNIIPTNGGDELLRLAITTFIESDETIAVTKPSYSLYPVLAAVQACKLVEIPLQSDWSMPDNFIDTLQASGAKMLMLVNPHAPTGGLLPSSYLAKIADNFSGVVLVDEAYVDFVDPNLAHDTVPLIAKYDNLLILRTLSKAYSLAGLRFGYGIGAESLIRPMMYKTRDAYNTDYIAQKLATAALLSVDYARQTWEKIRSERSSLASRLEALGMSVYPSQSNFLLCKMPAATDAAELCQALKQRNILVRHFQQDRLQDKLRISVGSKIENAALIAALDDILA